MTRCTLFVAPAAPAELNPYLLEIRHQLLRLRIVRLIQFRTPEELAANYETVFGEKFSPRSLNDITQEMINAFEKIFAEIKFMYLAELAHHCLSNPSPLSKLCYEIITHPLLQSFWEKHVLQAKGMGFDQFNALLISPDFTFADDWELAKTTGLYKSKSHYLFEILSGLSFACQARSNLAMSEQITEANLAKPENKLAKLNEYSGCLVPLKKAYSCNRLTAFPTNRELHDETLLTYIRVEAETALRLRQRPANAGAGAAVDTTHSDTSKAAKEDALWSLRYLSPPEDKKRHPFSITLSAAIHTTFTKDSDAKDSGYPELRQYLNDYFFDSNHASCRWLWMAFCFYHQSNWRLGNEYLSVVVEKNSEFKDHLDFSSLASLNEVLDLMQLDKAEAHQAVKILDQVIQHLRSYYRNIGPSFPKIQNQFQTDLLVLYLQQKRFFYCSNTIKNNFSLTDTNFYNSETWLLMAVQALYQAKPDEASLYLDWAIQKTENSQSLGSIKDLLDILDFSTQKKTIEVIDSLLSQLIKRYDEATAVPARFNPHNKQEIILLIYQLHRKRADCYQLLATKLETEASTTTSSQLARLKANQVYSENEAAGWLSLAGGKPKPTAYGWFGFKSWEWSSAESPTPESLADQKTIEKFNQPSLRESINSKAATEEEHKLIAAFKDPASIAKKYSMMELYGNFYQAFHLSTCSPPTFKGSQHLLAQLINTLPNNNRFKTIAELASILIYLKMLDSSTEDAKHIGKNSTAKHDLPLIHTYLIKQLTTLYETTTLGGNYCIAALIQKLYTEKIKDSAKASIWFEKARANQTSIAAAMKSLNLANTVQKIAEPGSSSTLAELVAGMQVQSLHHFTSEILIEGEKYTYSHSSDLDLRLKALGIECLEKGALIGNFSCLHKLITQDLTQIRKLKPDSREQICTLITRILKRCETAIQYHGVAGYLLEAEIKMQIAEYFFGYQETPHLTSKSNPKLFTAEPSSRCEDLNLGLAIFYRGAALASYLTANTLMLESMQSATNTKLEGRIKNALYAEKKPLQINRLSPNTTTAWAFEERFTKSSIPCADNASILQCLNVISSYELCKMREMKPEDTSMFESLERLTKRGKTAADHHGIAGKLLDIEVKMQIAEYYFAHAGSLQTSKPVITDSAVVCSQEFDYYGQAIDYQAQALACYNMTISLKRNIASSSTSAYSSSITVLIENLAKRFRDSPIPRDAKLAGPKVERSADDDAVVAGAGVSPSKGGGKAKASR